MINFQWVLFPFFFPCSTSFFRLITILSSFSITSNHVSHSSHTTMFLFSSIFSKSYNFDVYPLNIHFGNIIYILSHFFFTLPDPYSSIISFTEFPNGDFKHWCSNIWEFECLTISCFSSCRSQTSRWFKCSLYDYQIQIGCPQAQVIHSGQWLHYRFYSLWVNYLQIDCILLRVAASYGTWVQCAA